MYNRWYNCCCSSSLRISSPFVICNFASSCEGGIYFSHFLTEFGDVTWFDQLNEGNASKPLLSLKKSCMFHFYFWTSDVTWMRSKDSFYTFSLDLRMVTKGADLSTNVSEALSTAVSLGQSQAPLWSPPEFSWHPSSHWHLDVEEILCAMEVCDCYTDLTVAFIHWHTYHDRTECVAKTEIKFW